MFYNDDFTLREVNGYPCVVAEDDKVYNLSQRLSDYSYNILEIKKENGKMLEMEVKNPTLNQFEYALLNAIIEENIKDRSKTGIYNLDIEQIYDAYINMVNSIQNRNYSINDFFVKFGLNCEDETRNVAMNNTISTLIKLKNPEVKKENLNFVLRCPNGVVDSIYYTNKNGSYYTLTNSQDGKNNYQIMKNHHNEEEIVKNPSLTEKEQALLNYIIEDNFSNPSKSGIYNLHEEQIFSSFKKLLVDIRLTKIDSQNIINRFGLNKIQDANLKVAIISLIEEILNDKNKKESKNLEYTL